jgi:hypothetical protein
VAPRGIIKGFEVVEDAKLGGEACGGSLENDLGVKLERVSTSFLLLVYINLCGLSGIGKLTKTACLLRLGLTLRLGCFKRSYGHKKHKKSSVRSGVSRALISASKVSFADDGLRVFRGHPALCFEMRLAPAVPVCEN